MGYFTGVKDILQGYPLGYPIGYPIPKKSYIYTSQNQFNNSLNWL